MKTRRHHLAAALTGLALATSAHAAVLIQDNFDNGTGNLNGQGVDVNNIGGTPTWVSPTTRTVISANGVFADAAANTIVTDTGAYLDLGASFAFLSNTTYTLTLGWSGLNNRGNIYAGFSDAFITPIDGASRMRTMNNGATTSFSLGINSAAAIPTIDIFDRQAPTNTTTPGTVATSASGSATLTLTTNSLNNAVLSVTGNTRSVNLTANNFRYLFIDVEDASVSGSPATATFDSLQFEVIPEPSSAALIGLAGASLLLRRRRH